MSFLDRVFKRKKQNDIGIDLECVPNWHDELFTNIGEFILKNKEDKASTQLILENGKSVVMSYEWDLAHESRSCFVTVVDQEGNDLAMIYLNSIVAVGRVPKGKHVCCD